MALSYEEFLERARNAPQRNISKELRQLFVDGGTLQTLVGVILEGRGHLAEALINKQMVSEQDIRMAIGMQAQVMGIDYTLRQIYEALTQEESNEPTEEIPAEQRVP